MTKKLTKHGNSFAIIIDKPILKMLDIDEKTELKIKTDGKRIIIVPELLNEDLISESENIQKVYEKLIKKYEIALKKLAKN